jgi:hypothetical protein
LKFFKRLLNKIESDIYSNKHDDDSDAIFSLTSASISLEEKLDVQFSGSVALCIKEINGSLFESTIKDCKDFLDASKDEFKFRYDIFLDSYNYLWFIIMAKDFAINQDTITNVAAGLSSIGDIIEENGFSDQILSAIFKFNFSNRNFLEEINAGRQVKDYNTIQNLYLIYNYKTNNFYPYIPINSQRDTTKEMQVLSIIKNLVSAETDISKWYPIKDIPF